ncbi:hypothetical protein BDY19DRAFT_974432 [Irpex rosettiformis]|uniref:Uncharacterized protein n=1 Tax=Irpex rosettiformis TaxID=378272 RepID=A0ACB8TQ45_9APHY|nr:hypothetical protein BDY19DRAFT_974432 [Irpex rosettiformis]
MTEYDYSPEGYERYLSTQNRVSNWVQEQNHRMQKYTNPYTNRSVSTPPIEHARHSSSRDRSHHRSFSHTSRPEPRRSLTTPVEAAPRSMHMSSTHTAVPAVYYNQATAPLTYVSPTSMGAYQQPKSYRTYQYDGSTREIVLPTPRAGETYVIIPPKGRRVEVVDSYGGSRSSSKSSLRGPTSPPKNQPLFKRLFTGLGGGQPTSSAKLSRSSSTRRERTRSY